MTILEHEGASDGGSPMITGVFGELDSRYVDTKENCADMMRERPAGGRPIEHYNSARTGA